MFLARINQFVLALLFVVLPNTLYGATTLPEFYGMYAFDQGKYHEFQVGEDYSNSNYGAKVRFLVFLKDISSASKRISLQRLVYVRNVVVHYPAGLSKPEIKPYNKWHLGSGHTIKTRIKPVKGESEMIYVVPREKLAPGLYALSLAEKSVRFYIQATLIPKILSQSEHCVDLATMANAFSYRRDKPQGKETKCSQSKVVATNAGVGATGQTKQNNGLPVSPKNSKQNIGLHGALNKNVSTEAEYRRFIKDENKRSQSVFGKSALKIGGLGFGQSKEWKNINSLRKVAHKAYQSKDYQKAIENYKQIMEKDPKDWWGHAVLGDCYIETGKIDKGLEHIATAIQTLPANFLFVIVYKAYAIKDDIPTAQKWLEKALNNGYTPSAEDVRELLENSQNNIRIRELLKKHGVKG